MDTTILFYNHETDQWLSFDYFHADSDYCLNEALFRAYKSWYSIKDSNALQDEVARAIWKYEVDHGISQFESWDEWKYTYSCYGS